MTMWARFSKHARGPAKWTLGLSEEGVKEGIVGALDFFLDIISGQGYESSPWIQT